ncbi:MAG: GMC family oxidoreductase N-terminal domain-containing protein [Alphaproteobacteria bacterium]|nr:GMC family oxidoreductase N-terminal domain-containing protein [Alphaproteobacteria bacterium]
MIIRKNSIVRIFCYLFISLITYLPGFAATNDLLHNKIVQELLPASSYKVIEEKVGDGLREYLLGNPNVEIALEQIKPFSNDPFSLDALIHHKDPKASKAAAFLRRFYLYVLYSGPSLDRIVHQTDQIYPESHIRLEQDVLTFDGEDVDYLIIGSGPSGSLIASQFAEAGVKKVLLIDAGPFVKPGSINSEYDTELMESFNQRFTVSGGIAIRNGRAIGGGTTVNIDLAFSPLLPSIKNTLTRWINQDHIPSHFVHQNGKDFGIIHNTYEWVRKNIGTRAVNYQEINPNNLILLKGYPSALPYELNAKRPSGQKGEILKISAVDALLWPAMNKYPKALQVASNLQVSNLKLSNNQVTEITVKPTQVIAKDYLFSDPHNLNLDPTKTYKIRAKTVILAAGTMGSAEILLRSNISNRNVGKGLIMHPSIGVLGIFPEPIFNTEGLLAAVYAPSIPLADGYFFESMSADAGFIASVHPGMKDHIAENISQFPHIGGFGVMLVDRPTYGNRVFIDEKGQVQVDYKLSHQDKHRFRKAIIAATKVLFEQGAKEVFIPSLESIYQTSSKRSFASYGEAKKAIKQLQFKDNLTLLSSAHMQGTNKIGNNPRSSVVSKKFKVWNQATGQEFDNLYVVDSSIFPSSIGANPMQSIYTFAKIFVDQHLGKTSLKT